MGSLANLNYLNCRHYQIFDLIAVKILFSICFEQLSCLIIKVIKAAMEQHEVETWFTTRNLHGSFGFTSPQIANKEPIQ